jgi:hypothetical protein
MSTRRAARCRGHDAQKSRRVFTSGQKRGLLGRATSSLTRVPRQKGKRPDELKTLDAPPGDEESSMTASKFWEAWIAFVFEAG